MENKSGIYEILNTVNGKRYIGSAKNFKVRWGEHRSLLRRKCHHSIHLQRAWDKHGEQSFIFQAILACTPTKQVLEFHEQFMFELLKPEYNILPTAGTTLGFKPTAETRAKMSLAQRGSTRPERSIEHRKKQADAIRGKKATQETCTKISNALRGNNYALGHKHTPETRAKISARLKGRTPTQETRVKLSTAQRGKIISPGQRLATSIRCKGVPLTAKHRAAISKRGKGRKFTPEHRLRISKANIGRALSAAHRAAISAGMKGRKPVKCTAEIRAKLSLAAMGNQRSMGRIASLETKLKMSESGKLAWQRRRAVRELGH